MEKCKGDLAELAAFDRYKKLITARLWEASLELKLIPSKPRAVCPTMMPITDRPPPISEIHADDMSRAALARAEATFFDEVEGRLDFEGLGFDVVDSLISRNVPPEIISEAIRNDSRVGIDLLALGKPGGDIFNPGHWMYE